MITKDAQDRMYSNTLHDQLAKHRQDLVIARAHNELQGKLIERRISKIDVEFERRRLTSLQQDQLDITTGFAADSSWSGQHARLVK